VTLLLTSPCRSKDLNVNPSTTAMAGPSPEGYLVMLTLALTLPIALAIARHLLQRRSSRINTPKSSIITDCFYYGSLATHIALCSMLIYRTSTEIQLRNFLWQNPPSGETSETIIFQRMTEPKMLLLLWLAGCCYYTVVCLVKGAFLAFYWGLYDHAGIPLKWIKVTIILTFVSAVLATAFGIGWCRPINRNWSSDYDDYVKCTSVNSVTVRCLGTITNVITDTASELKFCIYVTFLKLVGLYINPVLTVMKKSSSYQSPS